MVREPRHHIDRSAREGGFTLTELLVVMGLMGLVLGAAYMFLNVANVINRSAQREASLARAVTTPMLTMERLLMQNSAIDDSTNGSAPSAYSLCVLTDQNGDDQLEQHTFTAVRAGNGAGYIDSVTYATAGGVRVGAARQSGHIGFDNANIRDSVALFRYYGADGVEITDYGAVASTAVYVVIQLRATVDGVTETHTDKVMFRNRER